MLERMIEKKLAEYQDNYLENNYISAQALKRIEMVDDTVVIEIILGYPHKNIKEQMISEIKTLLLPLTTDKQINIQFQYRAETHVGRSGIASLANIKNIIAVASGKGGVGKSTLACNLALALQQEGASVGILDADFYGPSQPTMLGVQKEKPLIKDKKLNPILINGLQAMSIGFLVNQESPMVWRGPMIGKALEQLLYDTEWQALDYLIIDLPPGTGDVQLTLCQKIPLSGALLITTPQDIALLDVARACEMFNKLNIPVLGLVENMQLYQCSQCGHQEPIFGEGGALKLANQYHLPILGQLPLDLQIRKLSDRGTPLVLADPESHLANTFRKIARKVAAKIALTPKDYSSRMPKIVIEK